MPACSAARIGLSAPLHSFARSGSAVLVFGFGRPGFPPSLRQPSYVGFSVSALGTSWSDSVTPALGAAGFGFLPSSQSLV